MIAFYCSVYLVFVQCVIFSCDLCTVFVIKCFNIALSRRNKNRYNWAI